jgi:hypothetical protein
MNKKGKYVDHAFLIIIGVLIAFTIYRHYSADLILSINTYLGFLLFAIACTFKFFNIAQSKYLVFILLVLYTFNIVNFTAENFNMSVGVDPGSLVYSWPSINPLAILFLIVYLFLNGSIIKKIYTNNEEEAKIKFDKQIDFYHNKFSECSQTELAAIFDNYAKYPEEARAALDKIKIDN